MKVAFIPSALMVAIGLTLVGCGGGDTAKADSTVSTTGELADVQEITINNGAEPESLDPHKVSGVPESNLLRQMLVGLVSTDKDGKTVAGMAQTWESADNKVWKFNLRDAKWSNGDPVTAHDFVYSFRRLVNPQTASPYATYLVGLKVANAKAIVDGKAKVETLGVKAIDDKTLEITLDVPLSYFPDALIHSSVRPVNQKVVEALGDKWTTVGNFVGNGAYILKDWKVNERITLERNKNYYDDANTTINTVNFLVIPQDATDVSRYKAGEVDMTADTLPPSTQFQALKKELGEQVRVQPKLCAYYYDFNHTKPPFNDVRVRKALSLTLDRETIAEKVLAQGQKVSYQYTPEATANMTAYTPEWKSWDKEKRIAEAKKLLTEAGYSDSNPLSFELLYNTSEQHKTVAVAATSFWKTALGGMVNVTLNNQEWKTYLETRRNQNHQMSRGGWCADYNEPSTFLNTLRTGDSNNYGKYSNPEFDKLLDAAATATPAERAGLYQQAEALLDKDSSSIFVYQYVSPRLVKPYVQGLTETDPLNHYHVKDLKILKH